VEFVEFQIDSIIVQHGIFPGGSERDMIGYCPMMWVVWKSFASFAVGF